MSIVTDPSHPFADFRNFLYAVWKFLNLPDPTPVQYDIAHFLQHGPDRSGVEAFRGVGKSFVTAALCCWCWYWAPNFRIMVVSASEGRANAFSQFCLRLLNEMPELKHLAPRANQRRSLEAFDVNGATIDQSPSMKSVGITGQLTGSRADLIIADDVEVPKNSQTQSQREKLAELVKEFDAVIKPLAHARIVYLGTPQVEDSLYNVLAKRGYVFRIWPARKPTPAQEVNYAGKLAPMIADLQIAPGKPTDPVRFSEEDLARRELSYGRSGFALQFMLDTALSDADKYPLRCSDLIVMDVDREVAPVKVTYASGPDQKLPIDCVGLTGDRWYGPMYVSKDHAEFTDSIMYVDPAGRGADKTAYAVLKILNGMIYLRRAGGMDGGYDEMTLTTLAHIAQAEKVKTIIVESNFGDGMFNTLLAPYLQRIHPCALEEERVNTQKEVRIVETLEPVLNQHRLVVDRSIVVNDMANDVEHQLFHQLTRITRERGALSHDDLLDCLAGGVRWLQKNLEVDHYGAEEKHRAELMDQEIAKFMENALGITFGEPNWTDAV